MKAFKFLIMALIFFVAGFFVGQGYQGTSFNQPADNQISQQPEKITLVIQFSETEAIEIQNIEPAAGQTVLGLLEAEAQKNGLALKTKDYGDLGVLVEGIGDVLNGQDNKYWQYFVDGEQVMIGAGQSKLKGGERVEWRFQASEF